MKFSLWAVIMGLSGISGAMAADGNLVTCDTLYSKRGVSSLQAGLCYQEILKSRSVDNRTAVFDRLFVTLSAVVTEMPKDPAERKAIDLGLDAVSQYGAEFGSDARYYYWKACFASFDAIEKDRGTVIPLKMFAVLGDLQEWLQKAIKLDPTVHQHGPARVLGIMHTEMPAIAGGDKTLAEKLLKEAYSKAPSFSMNHLAYAKILDVNGKSAEAIRVLKKYLATETSAFDPDPKQPLLSVAPETIREKAEAKKLLNDLTE